MDVWSVFVLMYMLSCIMYVNCLCLMSIIDTRGLLLLCNR